MLKFVPELPSRRHPTVRPRTKLRRAVFAFCLTISFAAESAASAHEAARGSASDPVAEAGGKVDSSWKQTRNRHGIRVFKRDLPNTKLVSFKGVGVIDAPVDVVLSVILDQDRLSEWAEDRSKSRVVRWIRQPIEYISYDRIELPWPLKDREFVTRIRIDVDGARGRTRVSYNATNDRVGKADDTVRGSLVGSYYVLEPIDGGTKTRATGVVVADPRGSIPAWVVNLYQRNWPYDTIMAIRKQAKKPDLVVLPRLRSVYEPFRARLNAASHGGTPQRVAAQGGAEGSP